MKKIYFKGLNGIRFFAALLVIMHHLEFIKHCLGYSTIWSMEYSSYLGAFGVTVFFVLSGFLITYLLLCEKEVKSIHIKHFYVRRMLRIWPLYFLIIFIAFFILPHFDFFHIENYSTDMTTYKTRLILFSFLLANVSFVYLPNVAFANVLWSVAVEEQFYLFWPYVIKIKKYLFRFMIFLLVFFFILKLGGKFFFPQDPINQLIYRTRFSSMIIGGIGAYGLYKRAAFLQYLYKKPLQLIAVSVFFLLLLDMLNFQYFSIIKTELTSLIICVLILNISSNDQSILKLENRYLNYLGKISYGLYVYHMIVIVAVLKFASSIVDINTLQNTAFHPVLLISITLATIVLSHFSYNYFERPFITKKLNYSVIVSGDLVKSNK
ncbi:acyltransferase [Rapidithrix thailandica]|uniref:Acyltransferase n=1 Tax=Rapidithrix thailandica TaxID=413964 RepID=A0AAW9SC79_9BACT